MSRPKPNIIHSSKDKLGNQWDITSGEVMYLIVYDNKPIGVRQHINSLYYNGFKYRKLNFTNLASATNQAKKLNEIFQTNLFSVRTII